MKKGQVFVFLVLCMLILTPVSFAQEETDPEQEQIPEVYEQSESPEDEIFSPNEENMDSPSNTPQESFDDSKDFEEKDTSEDYEDFERKDFPESEKEYFGEEEIPEGCKMKETGNGIMQMECDFDKQEFNEFNIKNEMDNCDGKFEIVEGNPVCIKQGNAGFASTECPTQEELDEVEKTCQGKVEHFVDEGGCSSVMCINENFKKQFDEKLKEKYKEDPLKEQAIMCKKDGGKFTLIKGEPRCILREQETIKIKKELGKITQKEIENSAKRLEKMEDGIGLIKTKLENFEGEIFDEAKERLEGVENKIQDIKIDLAMGNLSEDKRREILSNVQSLKKTLSDVTTGIIEGKMPTEDYIAEEMFEQYEEFYGGPFQNKDELKQWVEKEKSSLEKVRNCDKYKDVESFVPPDPDGKIVKIDLSFSEGICKIIVYMADGESAEYGVPRRFYTTFRGTEDLIKQDISCVGSCDKLKKIITGPHGPGEDPEAEACMEKCIVRGCDDGMFACMEKNLEKCEDECGMRKGPEMDDREDMEGMPDMSKEEMCIMECVGPGVTCMPGQEEGAGEQNPRCRECAEKCVGLYEGACITEEQLEEKENACTSRCEHCYGEPIYGDSGEGYECIVDIECKDASGEFGDDSGTGPDSYEPGHENPGEEFDPTMTGEAIRETSNQGVFSKIVNWFKNLFGGKKQTMEIEISKGNTIEDLALDLNSLQKGFDELSEEMS